ncbi:sulfotransferase [Salinibacter ruber]|uniref:Sulfotransferase domain-containing protein n=1 Tax=Salinibacter ruber TaxID=146919 RepID=A0A9X2V8A8_9BACT|nr:sulfotransferase [Salinibacter ruber]MCS4122731.1 hypothetical protein [Salinibacter ruber]
MMNASSIRAIGNRLLDMYGRLRARRYDARDAIVVACTGRGGSTWLAQIITSLPRHHLRWEQLHWRTNPKCQEYGFGEPTYLTSEIAIKEQEKYVHQILSGQTFSSAIHTKKYFRPLKLLTVRSYVAKLVTANMMLPWLVETFGVRAVFMIRHPCAVVKSQLKHGAWDEVGKSFCEHPALFEAYPHLGSLFEEVERQEEVLAFNWAVQNFVPLALPQPVPWVTTTYETLVGDGMEEARRIFDALGEEVPHRAGKQFHTPSVTTVDSSNVAQGENPLTGWREYLSNRQVNRILSVTHEAALCFYTEALRPEASPSSLEVSV